MIGDGAQSLSDQLRRIERGQLLLLWKGATVILGSLLLLLGGGGWSLIQYRQEIGDNQLRAEQLRAYNAADVTLCGGRLCANVEIKSAGFDDRRQVSAGQAALISAAPEALPAAYPGLANVARAAGAGSIAGAWRISLLGDGLDAVGIRGRHHDAGTFNARYGGVDITISASE